MAQFKQDTIFFWNKVPQWSTGEGMISALYEKINDNTPVHWLQSAALA